MGEVYNSAACGEQARAGRNTLAVIAQADWFAGREAPASLLFRIVGIGIGRVGRSVVVEIAHWRLESLHAGNLA